MNRLRWLQQMAQSHPEQAEAWYWVGVEHMENDQSMEAVLAFTEGLKIADEQQKPLFLQKLALAASLPAKQLPQDESAHAASEPSPLAPPVAIVQSASPSVSPASNERPVERSDRGSHPFQVISGGQSTAAPAAEAASISFKDVAGLSDLKKTIHMKIISPFYNQGLFSKFRKKAGGGVLLYGPPGCGKTFIAKATAGECRANFYPIHIADILDPYIGVSERNLHELFSKARAQKPSILFIDEIDAIGHDRSKSSANFRGLVDTFLTEMEGIDSSTDQVLVMGATNMPWDVDNALKRPGRFDRLIFVAPPDEDARETIFRLKLDGRMAEQIAYDWLAKHTEYFSGADIEQVCERAVEFVLEEIMETNVERPIQMRDMERALQTVTPSTLEWLRTAKNFVRYANQSGSYNDVEDYLRKYGKRL
ncbi:AAA ATPase central domain protein [Paenibacillus curdlanolyticus YK9]|uniref:AAA ATPase central domain protein n=1 Tax=Paenibacillus curdlanolyticus YK9 TaxID=717606 RepID=E0ICS1_9BACL|nr:ATP-binding protein [Paenibacillus curdlanolyticus]EFM09957.1 AAA ATPase central domain protein [Paenibacillus curdlanolyticus YK9]